MDLNLGAGRDYVDNQYFSVQQVAVKLYALKNKVKIMDIDKGKVLLFVNVTMEQEHEEETKSMFSNLNRILLKYNQPGQSQLAVYAQYTHDVRGGESLLNKEIAQRLIKQGMLTQNLLPNSIRFLEKVSEPSGVRISCASQVISFLWPG